MPKIAPSHVTWRIVGRPQPVGRPFLHTWRHLSIAGTVGRLESSYQPVGRPFLHTWRHLSNSRVEPQTPPLGKCARPDCRMTQRYDLCSENTNVKLMLMYESDGQFKHIQVTAQGEQLQQIAGDKLTPNLLKSPCMKSVTIFNNRKILQKVHK